MKTLADGGIIDEDPSRRRYNRRAKANGGEGEMVDDGQRERRPKVVEVKEEWHTTYVRVDD